MTGPRSSQECVRCARVWLIVNPHTTALIRELAQGIVPLEHATFTGHSQPRKVAFLRDSASSISSSSPSTSISNGSRTG